MFKDAIYKGTLAVLTQSELLEFERMLASAPEVYDGPATELSDSVPVPQP